MIWKPPLVEAQTALEKQNEGRISPIPKFCKKNCFLAQNFTEIGQLAAELWLKTIFIMAAVRHLKFNKIMFGHVTVIKF